MLDFLKTVNKILRVVFIGFIGILAIVKALDIKSENAPVAAVDEDDYITSEFDEIW